MDVNETLWKPFPSATLMQSNVMFNKSIQFIVIIFLLSGCGFTSHSTIDELSESSKKYLRGLGHQDREVYLTYIYWDSVRGAHESLVKKSRKYADTKCGKDSPYTLVDHQISPLQYRGIVGHPPYISANVSCDKEGINKPGVFTKQTTDEAEKTCKEMGLGSFPKELQECIKELSTN